VAAFFLSLCREHVARGHRARALVWPAIPPDSQRAPEIELALWPSLRPTRMADARFLGRQLRSFRPDAIIANFASVNLMTLFGWRHRVPFRGVHYHTLARQLSLDGPAAGLKFYWQRTLKNLVYGSATHILANSQAGSIDAATHYRGAQGKGVVLYYGLADPLVSEAGFSPRQPCRIVCPGRLHPCKGQDVLLRALPRLVSTFPNLEVRFLGDGFEREPLESLASQLGVSRACRFLGTVPHETVLRELSQASVAVVPSRSEGFGMVNIETLACGTPLVASAVGGIPEILRDGLDGFLVPPEEPERLESRLRALLSSRELQAQMSGNARERFLSTFEIGVRVRHYADWLESELEIRVAGANSLA